MWSGTPVAIFLDTFKAVRKSHLIVLKCTLTIKYVFIQICNPRDALRLNLLGLVTFIVWATCRLLNEE